MCRSVRWFGSALALEQFSGRDARNAGGAEVLPCFGQRPFQVDGAAVGGTLDQYASSGTYPTATVATVTFATTGDNTFRMTVSSKNSASSSYTLSADKITLVGQ